MPALHNHLVHSVILIAVASVACGGVTGGDDPGREPATPVYSEPTKPTPPPFEATGPVLVTKEGRATGDGQRCSLDGVDWAPLATGKIPAGTTLLLGEGISLADRCTRCSCTRQGIECITPEYCSERSRADEPAAACSFRGTTYGSGDVFTAGDSCGSICSCGGSLVSCSARDCNAVCPAPKESSASCADAVVVAKAPDGTCCTYGTGCNAPDGWPLHNNETDCLSAP